MLLLKKQISLYKMNHSSTPSLWHSFTQCSIRKPHLKWQVMPITWQTCHGKWQRDIYVHRLRWEQ